MPVYRFPDNLALRAPHGGPAVGSAVQFSGLSMIGRVDERCLDGAQPSPTQTAHEAGRVCVKQRLQTVRDDVPDRPAGSFAHFKEQSSQTQGAQQLRVIAVPVERRVLVAAPARQEDADAERCRIALHKGLDEQRAVAVRSANAVSAQHVEDMRGAQHVVMQSQAFAVGNGFQAIVLGSFILFKRMFRWRVPGESLRAAALSAQFAGGESGDAGGVEAAAQVHAERMRAPQAVPHRLGVEVEKAFGVFLVRAARRRWRMLRSPLGT